MGEWRPDNPIRDIWSRIRGTQRKGGTSNAVTAPPIDDSTFPTYPFSRAPLLTFASGIFGLILLALVPRMSRKLALTPSQVDFSVTPFAWNIFNIGLIAWALSREGRRLTPRTAGLWPIRWRKPDWRSRSRWVAGFTMLGLIAFTASPVRRRLVDHTWSMLHGPEWSVNSTPSVIRGNFPVPVTPALAAFQLLVRNPFTVTVEEAYFQGFLYPRLGSWAPLKLAVLSGVYHLPQWWTIPTVVPWAAAIGIARELSGNPWPGIAIHYLGNATFVLGGLSVSDRPEGDQAVWFRALRSPGRTRHAL